MNINWKVSDGYVGHGPQSTEIDDGEIMACETVEEAMELIEDIVAEDFKEKVSWVYKNLESVRAEVEAMLKGS